MWRDAALLKDGGRDAEIAGKQLARMREALLEERKKLPLLFYKVGPCNF